MEEEMDTFHTSGLCKRSNYKKFLLWGERNLQPPKMRKMNLLTWFVRIGLLNHHLVASCSHHFPFLWLWAERYFQISEVVGKETCSPQNLGYAPENSHISPKSLLKMIFLFPRWDMFVSWRVFPPTTAELSAKLDHCFHFDDPELYK